MKEVVKGGGRKGVTRRTHKKRTHIKNVGHGGRVAMRPPGEDGARGPPGKNSAWKWGVWRGKLGRL